MTTIIFNDHIHARGWIEELRLEPEPEANNHRQDTKPLLSPRGEPLVKVNSFFASLLKRGFRVQRVRAVTESGEVFAQFILTDDKSNPPNEKLWNALTEMFGDKPIPHVTASKTVTDEHESLTISVWNTDPDRPCDTVYLHLGDEQDLYLSYYGTK